jgi:hypothetical protein
VDSIPSAIPERITVAGPVRAAAAVSVTGRLSGWVKWLVSQNVTSESTMPPVAAMAYR